MRRTTHALTLLFAGGLIACGQTVGQADNDEANNTPALEEREVDLDIISDPGHEQMTQTAPDEYDVLFHTTAGDFTVHVTRDWAPNGADRFYNLVDNGFYDGTRFFRVVPGFVVQWGMHGEPEVNAAWRASDDANIDDDPVTQSNTRGRVTFATSGPDSRTSQLFINYADNSGLDPQGFSAFGEVTGDGMDVVDAIESKYGQRPNQERIHNGGNAYLDASFPDLDHIITATIVEDDDE